MDIQLYKEILHDLSAIGGLNENDKFYTCLSKKYKSVPEETLRCIIALWNQREVSRISYEIKDVDIYKLYLQLRKSGNVCVCQHIAKQLNYPASLIAKVVLTKYAAAKIKESKISSKANEAKLLRKRERSPNTKKNISVIKTDKNSKANSLMKKHDDPRVELALNLFDEDDEIGKYFLDKFKFTRNRSNKNHVIRMKITDSDLPWMSKDDEESSQINIDSRDSETSDDSDTDSHDSEDGGGFYSVKELFENTNLIDDPIIALDVFMCNMSDDQYGSTSDMIANSSGQTYEKLLEEQVKVAGLSYKTENKLRGVGVDKTPDIILSVPVAVDGFVINWIESKALFADYKLHQEFKKNQFKNYINRFGPGLVIYWHGFVDNLPELYLVNKQIIIRDQFPSSDSFTFMNSNKFKTWMIVGNTNLK